MNDKLTKATFEQLLNGDVSQVSIINEVDFVVDHEVKAESALDVARQRWRYAELIIEDQHSERE